MKFVSFALAGLLIGLAPLPLAAQTPAQLQAAADAARPADGSNEAIGQVTTVQGNASVSRNNAATALQADAEIFKNDVLQTGTDGTVSITFDDETTFNLSPNTRVTVDEFIYSQSSKKNAAAFNVARGTVAFVASQVAKTGDMTIGTPTATMGIRGTTGLVEVPEGAGSGSAGDARIKLYPDSDGRVGQIEVFAPGQGGARFGQRLGLLTAGASAFAIRGAGGRFAAVPFAISAQEAARDRGVVSRLFQSHNFGRQIAAQRRQIRQQRGPGGGRGGLGPRPGMIPGGPRPGLLPGGPRGGLAPAGRPGFAPRALPGGRPALAPRGAAKPNATPRRRLPGERDPDRLR